MNKANLRKRIYHKKDRLEDRLVLDTNLPDWLADPLFHLGDAFDRLTCLVLGHAWDGPGVWCVFCDKQKRRV